MIAVTRKNKDEVQAALEKLGRDGLTERERVLSLFKNGSFTKKPSFKAYKAQEIKDELSRIFNRKCAYCESIYEHVAPMDVEHFRPKGAYILPDGKKSKTGYFWLAAEWSNLLPSCIDCNRERKQVRNEADGTVIKSKSGKANKFPIADENTRAKKPDDEKNEVALLLDPCVDKPTSHLEFTDDGSVRPKKSSAEKKLGKGKHSIEVYGLDRDGLMRERKKIMTRLKSQMNDVCSWTLALRIQSSNALFQKEVKRATKELKSFATKESTYLAMVKPMIRNFNSILKETVAYLDIKDQLIDDQGNAALQEELENKLRVIKRKADDQKPAANIVKSVVDWMGLLD